MNIIRGVSGIKLPRVTSLATYLGDDFEHLGMNLIVEVGQGGPPEAAHEFLEVLPAVKVGRRQV